MGFQQGLSGLNGSAKALEAIGNNISNANTVGFKQANPQFADVFASSISGAGSSSQVGIGTSVKSITQEFTQGNITSTNNPLDIAINGNGFYRMVDATGAPTYTREGQFQVNKDGYMVNSSGLRLSGVMPATGSTPVPIFIDTSNIPPVPTGAGVPVATGLVMGLNLDSRETLPINAWDQTQSPPVSKFNPTDPTTYNKSTSATVYDSLGNAHQLGLFFVKVPAGFSTADPADATAPTQDWKVYANIDNGKNDANSAAVAGGSPRDLMQPFTLTFSSSGKLLLSTDSADNGGAVSTTAGLFTAQLFPSVVSSAAVPVGPAPTVVGSQGPGFALNLSSTTQYGNVFGVNSITQDGYTSAQLSGLAVSQDGTVSGRYSNGQSKALGQITLTSFKNPNGLMSLGGNQWAETAASGQPQIGTPGAGANGILQSSAVEESNVDLTKQLVDMITQQRTYQANAQTIKTMDQILQTLVSMR